MTFEMRSETGPGASPVPWQELFAGLRADAPTAARAALT